jgi:hypothetical protein
MRVSRPYAGRVTRTRVVFCMTCVDIQMSVTRARVAATWQWDPHLGNSPPLGFPSFRWACLRPASSVRRGTWSAIVGTIAVCCAWAVAYVVLFRHESDWLLRTAQLRIRGTGRGRVC